jgi:hypothetical protein
MAKAKARILRFKTIFSQQKFEHRVKALCWKSVEL